MERGTNMKRACICVSREAVARAYEIKKHYEDMDIYTYKKYQREGCLRIQGGFKDFVGEVFQSYEILIFIMATGIVVRSIAPYLEHKAVDPAIIVMDDQGKYAIPILSGHIGEANKYSIELAQKMGAQAIVTTASDIRDLIAVDTLAMKHNLSIDNFMSAKEITAMLLDGDDIGVLSEVGLSEKFPENVFLIEEKDINEVDGIIFIGMAKRSFCKPFVRLIPRKYTVGIGCKKGMGIEHILNKIEETFTELGLEAKAISKFATVDVKQEEEGILAAAKHYHVRLEIIEREDILAVEDKFLTSDFVKETIGVGAVAEPCGYLASGRGKCIMEKKAYDGLTLSIWEDTNE